MKTVRRYLAAAKARGVEQAHGLGALDDELVAAVIRRRSRGQVGHVVRAGRSARRTESLHRAPPDEPVQLTKVGKLLRRRGVEIEYPTLRRFALEQLGFGRGSPSVPVADCDPGKELQVDPAG